MVEVDVMIIKISVKMIITIDLAKASNCTIPAAGTNANDVVNAVQAR